jgi:hypothetical protein
MEKHKEQIADMIWGTQISLKGSCLDTDLGRMERFDTDVWFGQFASLVNQIRYRAERLNQLRAWLGVCGKPYCLKHRQIPWKKCRSVLSF